LPPLAIAFVADMEDRGNRSREVLDAARDIGSQREADAEAGATARLLAAVKTIRAELGRDAGAHRTCWRRSGPGWEARAQNRPDLALSFCRRIYLS